MKRLLGVAILAVMACGCDDPQYFEMRHVSYYRTGGLVYFKDPATGLCFAAGGSGNTAVLANVPCTERVEALLR